MTRATPVLTRSNSHKDERSVRKSAAMRSLLNLEDVDLARVFQCLSPVAEPHSHHLSVIVQLSRDLGNLLARRQGVLLEVGVEDFYRLRREARAPLAFFGRFAADKLHQILLAFLVPVLGLGQPFFQHRLQLLSALGGDVQLLKPAAEKKAFTLNFFVGNSEAGIDFDIN